MELTVKRESFFKLLQKVQPIIEKKSTMPILSHTLLDVKQDYIEVLATDLELAFKGDCLAEVRQTGSIVVPARELYEIVKNLNCERINLKENENKWLEITGNGSYFCLASLPVEEFPLFPETDHFNTVSISGEVLRKAIMKTYFSIAKEDLNADYAGLCCEKIKDKEPKLRFVSTDTYRLTYMEIPFAEIDSLQFDSRVMIPKKAALEILRLTSHENLYIGFDTQAGIVRTNGDLIYTRLMENKFPEYQTFIPEKNEYEAKIPRINLKDILKRMVVLVREKVKIAEFLFKKDSLIVRVENPAVGEAEEKLAIEFITSSTPVEKLKMSFNISYLLDVLNALESEVFTFGLNTGRTPCVITGENDVGFKALVVPLIESE
ncbi:MAG: DNA polymerase III subunit beta [Candidatus Desulfofervidaceae bacterium]|nr:DNA polymerase III subunit beta [Candidatus Desulfofervidaceae bacterium]